MDQRLKKHMEEYIEEHRRSVKRLYLGGMIADCEFQGVIGSFLEDVIREAVRTKSELSPGRDEKENRFINADDKRELYQMMHYPIKKCFPEETARLYMPYLNQYYKPFVAWMKSRWPEEFDPDGEEGRSYTVSAEETNSCVSKYDHQMKHECRLWIYDRLDVTPEEINENKEKLHFLPLPEELPVENIVTGKDTKRAEGNIIPISFGTNQLYGNPVFRKEGRIYHCIGEIDGYRPFEGLCTYYGEEDTGMEIYTLLDEEKDHPRWQEYYKWREILDDDYDRQIKECGEWLKADGVKR